MSLVQEVAGPRGYRASVMPFTLRRRLRNVMLRNSFRDAKAVDILGIQMFFILLSMYTHI
jgi:hypothetical protein